MASSSARILVVDDHPKMAQLLLEQLTEAGYTVEAVTDGAEAIALLRARPVDLVLTDLRMEHTDGFDVLRAVRAFDETIPVLIMTAFGAVDTAVEAIKAGAYHYVTKPFKVAEILIYVQRALAERRLREENRELRKAAAERTGNGQLVGRSEAMRRLYETVERVAQAQATVLVRGESGAGKELVARAIHSSGARAERPFVAVNCTAIPESLLESELFGHVKGAFTGARAPRRGLLVEADQGTLFLDEIGDMPMGLQAKLLRVLEDGEVRAVGADAPRQVDVRVIAATHQDLEAKVADRSFRADLFYRLNVVQILVPPLRERMDDLPLLVEAFLRRARARNPASPVAEVAPEVLRALAVHSWPGNVRELENTIERLVVLAGQPVIGRAELELHAPTVMASSTPQARARAELVTLRQLEQDYIAFVLDRCGGNKAKAAEILDIDLSTLYRREKQAQKE